LESLLLAILVAAIVWLVMRHGRTLRRPAPARPTMPRIGTPGTVTPEQLERLKALEFEPASDWSREEADLLLHAVDYLRQVILAVRGDADPPIELQNRLLVFILSDAALRERVAAWAASGAAAPLERDTEFERVATQARRL
jgi:hypothetical protein